MARLLLMAAVFILAAAGCSGLQPLHPRPTETVVLTECSSAVRGTSTSVGKGPSPTPALSVTSTRDLAPISSPKPNPTSSPVATAKYQAATRGTSPTDAPTPTKTPTGLPPPLPSSTPVLVTDAHVVYHNGFSQDGVGVYERGAFPWLDLLVQLGGTWYGPERELEDGINPIPLPEDYRWETEGGFGSLPNGEAWWAKSSVEGVARLIGPDEVLLLEVPLLVYFRGSGAQGDEPELDIPPTPT